MLLGNVYKKMKRPQEAIAAYRDALARDDEHQNALFSLALAYKDEGRFDEARVGFERARELDPEEREGALAARRPLDAAGRLRPRRGRRHRRARAKGRRAPVSPEARRDSHRGEAVRRGRAARSGARSRRSRGWRSPTSTSASCYEGKGQLDKAIDAYEAELATNPKAYRAAFNAAKLLQKVGRASDAIAHFRKVVEIEPAFGTGHLYLAQALLEAGDLDGAEQWARSGLENNPEPRMAPLGHYVLADVYEQRGRMAEAKREVAAAERLKSAR